MKGPGQVTKCNSQHACEKPTISGTQACTPRAAGRPSHGDHMMLRLTLLIALAAAAPVRSALLDLR